MRAAIVDRRMEAVAGPILHDVSEPTVVPFSSGGAVIFVGQYEYWPEETGSGQMAIHRDNDYNQYFGRNPVRLVGSAPMTAFMVGDVAIAYANIPPSYSSIGLGRHRTSLNYAWRGRPMRCVVLPGQDRSAAQLKQIAYAMIPTL